MESKLYKRENGFWYCVWKDGNNKIISGKLVSFKRPMNDVLKELNNSCHNLSVGKTKYDMTTILVNVNNQLKDANIIF